MPDPPTSEVTSRAARLWSLLHNGCPPEGRWSTETQRYYERVVSEFDTLDTGPGSVRPTSVDPWKVTLCWTPEQNFRQVSTFSGRVPVLAVVGMLKAGEPVSVVAAEHGLTTEEVTVIQVLAEDLAIEFWDTSIEFWDTSAEEVRRLHTWAGLMSLLDEHYPADLFDGPSGDPGPRIVRLIRQVDQLRHELREADQQCQRMQASDVRKVLADLVALKDGPRDENYSLAKDAAWSAARAALAIAQAAPARNDAVMIRATPQELLDRRDRALTAVGLAEDELRTRIEECSRGEPTPEERDALVEVDTVNFLQGGTAKTTTTHQQTTRSSSSTTPTATESG